MLGEMSTGRPQLETRKKDMICLYKRGLNPISRALPFTLEPTLFPGVNSVEGWS